MTVRAAFLLPLSLVVAACAPVQLLVDNPKDGSTIELVSEQPLRLRLTNVNGGTNWVWDETSADAVAFVGHEVKPAAGGALGLQFYDFKAVKPGTAQLTFAHRASGAAASPEDEFFTVTVAVK